MTNSPIPPMSVTTGKDRTDDGHRPALLPCRRSASRETFRRGAEAYRVTKRSPARDGRRDHRRIQAADDGRRPSVARQCRSRRSSPFFALQSDLFRGFSILGRQARRYALWTRAASREEAAPISGNTQAAASRHRRKRPSQRRYHPLHRKGDLHLSILRIEARLHDRHAGCQSIRAGQVFQHSGGWGGWTGSRNVRCSLPQPGSCI